MICLVFFFQISNGATIKVFKKKANTRSGNKGTATYLKFCVEWLGMLRAELWQIVSWSIGAWRNWCFDIVEPNEEAPAGPVDLEGGKDHRRAYIQKGLQS